MIKRKYPDVLASERVIGNVEFAVTKTSDLTENMDIYCDSFCKYVSEDGFPKILHFFVTKNSNTLLTEKNGLLDLEIPIIPAAWNTKSTASMQDFVMNAKSSEEIKKRVQETPIQVREKRKNSDTAKMLNYIKYELGLRYSLAKDQNDQNTMQIISGLKMMQNFDLELLSLIAHNPSQVTKTSDGRCFLTFSNGSTADISKKQYAAVGPYVNNLKVHDKTKKEYIHLMSILEDYKYYDIQQVLNETTTPYHSVNMANKNKPKPSEMGDE